MKDIRTAVSEFVCDVVMPAANNRDFEVGRFPQEVVDGMAELGLFGTIIPVEYGGLGLSLREHCVLAEKIAWGWLSMAGVLNPHLLCSRLLLEYGTEKQKRELLPDMAAGRRRACFSLTEAEAGSDVQAITTSASRVGEMSWEVSGHKRWITNGLGASLIFVLVKTDPTAVPAHRGMTCVIVEKEPWSPVGAVDARGVGVGEVIEKMGDRGVETTDLILDRYIVGVDRILGGEAGLGAGFKQMIGAMEAGRIGASSLCVGIAQRCLDLAIDYARSRRTFGAPIAEHQGVQSKIANMVTDIRASRLLTHQAAEVKDAGARADVEAGVAKLFASEAAGRAAAASFAIHGANGYSRDTEIERLYRDVASLTSAEGPADIQRMVIARGALRSTCPSAERVQG